MGEGTVPLCRLIVGNVARAIIAHSKEIAASPEGLPRHALIYNECQALATAGAQLIHRGASRQELSPLSTAGLEVLPRVSSRKNKMR